MGWWETLGDDELEARLRQRGLPDRVVAALVADRDDDAIAAGIAEVLDG